MAPCTVNKDVQLIPKKRTRIKSGLQRFGLHLRNMRLIGGDTVITAALLPLLGFFLLHGLKDVPWLTIACLLLVGLLLTATIFGLNNVTDAKINACDPLKQTNGINPSILQSRPFCGMASLSFPSEKIVLIFSRPLVARAR